MRGHAVELVGERLELVAGVDVDLLVELAGADTLRAFVERPDGTHHAARERKRAECGEHEPAEQQQRGAHDRRVELRVTPRRPAARRTRSS